MIAQTRTLERKMIEPESLGMKTLDELILAPLTIGEKQISPIFELGDVRFDFLRDLVKRNSKRAGKFHVPCEGTFTPYIFRENDLEVLKKTQAFSRDFISDSESSDKKETKEFFKNTFFDYSFNANYPILGNQRDFNLITEFFHHIVKEFTQNAFNNYFSLLTKRLDILDVAKAKTEYQPGNEAVPLKLNGSQEEYEKINSLLNNYRVLLKTYIKDRSCIISCINPALLDEEEEKNLVKNINDALLYNYKKSSDTTKAIEKVTDPKKKWGSFGFYMISSFLKSVNGDITFYYNPSLSSFEISAKIPLKEISKIPKALNNYGSF
ncbi:hypothetical protein DRJ22_04320 [Candidatus Woesearchaeota archaeon]|nr:MAG: hypothetical protein B6U93_01825 [Candidatus Woesearchaeota archaeon ex4484_78]RLE45462.1 MAG: hypothetical protein DRJ22_04320 [Candidatus Woesearchaeota archaeon]